MNTKMARLEQVDRLLNLVDELPSDTRTGLDS
jgi:hypothetical protein